MTSKCFILPIDLYDFSNAQPENINVEDYDRHMQLIFHQILVYTIWYLLMQMF